ncbi:hypothetical protein FDP41_010670 [Naegleria fowleri]|uniref:ENT domain-containing protein n=1 Tax=Naegleria fowleri TaxID=5763 RepID=A0A6A5CE12_NAEFO|nr:uncharacterized protein FDP41_010670 [Naegleria fowleri]KAF0983605.1 hypothetical protein FDP41_010670 [Naegleria fowleri]
MTSLEPHATLAANSATEAAAAHNNHLSEVPSSSSSFGQQGAATTTTGSLDQTTTVPHAEGVSSSIQSVSHLDQHNVGGDQMLIDEPIVLSEKQLVKRLRQYEINAYSSVVSAFRAQGEMNWEKLKVLTQLQQMLHISTNRHSMELLRCEADVKIQQVAQSGVYSIIDREAEDRNNRFDFTLTASDTESEHDNDVHYRVKRSTPSSTQPTTQPTPTTRRASSGRGRGRGRGRKRSSATMTSETLSHSPSKASTLYNLDPSSTNAANISSLPPQPNTPTKATSVVTSTTPNGTPAKKKRGRKPKNQQLQQPPVETPKQPQAPSEATPKLSEEIAKILAETTFLSDDDIRNINDEEQVETVAERESNQIEELNKKLSEGLSPLDTEAMMEAIKKKKAILQKLIQKLESFGE